MKDINQVVIYKSSDGNTHLEVQLENDSIWLTQKQMSDPFGTEVPAISKHVTNIYKTGELDYSATVSKMETVRQEGNRKVTRT